MGEGEGRDAERRRKSDATESETRKKDEVWKRSEARASGGRGG